MVGLITGGVSVPSGAATGAAIVGGIAVAVTPSIPADATSSSGGKNKARARERKAYKTYCENPPPPSGDYCKDLAAKRNHAKQCADMREAHADKWYNGGDEGHREQVRRWRKRTQLLEDQMRDTCPQLCKELGI